MEGVQTIFLLYLEPKGGGVHSLFLLYFGPKGGGPDPLDPPPGHALATN